MKLISLKQLEKKKKESLIRFIIKQIRIIANKKTKKQLASFAYNIAKSNLPQLKTTKQKKLTKKKEKKKNKNKEKKQRTAKQKRADKKNGDRLKKWMRDNR